MIRDGIDPPQIILSLRQTHQLIDPLTTTDLRTEFMRRSTLASFGGNFIHGLVDPVAQKVCLLFSRKSLAQKHFPEFVSSY